MIYFKDAINVVNKLTFRRLHNLLRLQLNFTWSQITKKVHHKSLPYAVSVEPTTACNLSCPACPSGLKSFSRPTGKIDLLLHKKWLSEIASHVFYINYYFQGEPFLHPQFLELIKEANAKKVYTSTSTNAHFINEKKAKEIIRSGLDRLIISLDGLTQETYESYRIDGKLEKVLEGAKHLVQAKKELKSATPHLIFQFLVVASNEHEIPAVNQLAKDLGVNEVRFKSAQIYDFEKDGYLIPTNAKYARYVQTSEGWKFKFRLKNKCWRQWSSAVITWDGKVVPCAFDKDANHVLGDLNDTDFKSIWKGEKSILFKQQILKNRSENTICTNCTEGAEVFV